MAEVTAFGKALRKMRIDFSEVLGTMADKLNVSAAFLSAVEHGKRSIPKDFVERICKAYKLSAQQRQELELAQAKSKDALVISFADSANSDECYEMALAFARTMPSLNKKQILEVNRLLKSFAK